MDNGGEINGELFSFLVLEGKAFADGESTADPRALSVKREDRGCGYGTGLMTALLEKRKSSLLTMKKALC